MIAQLCVVLWQLVILDIFRFLIAFWMWNKVVKVLWSSARSIETLQAEVPLAAVTCTDWFENALWWGTLRKDSFEWNSIINMYKIRTYSGLLPQFLPYDRSSYCRINFCQRAQNQRAQIVSSFSFRYLGVSIFVMKSLIGLIYLPCIMVKDWKCG